MEIAIAVAVIIGSEFGLRMFSSYKAAKIKEGLTDAVGGTAAGAITGVGLGTTAVGLGSALSGFGTKVSGWMKPTTAPQTINEQIEVNEEREEGKQESGPNTPAETDLG